MLFTSLTFINFKTLSVFLSGYLPFNQSLNDTGRLHHNGRVSVPCHYQKLRLKKIRITFFVLMYYLEHLWNGPMYLLSHCGRSGLFIAIVDKNRALVVGTVVVPLSKKSPNVPQRCDLAVAPMQHAVKVLRHKERIAIHLSPSSFTPAIPFALGLQVQLVEPKVLVLSL